MNEKRLKPGQQRRLPKIPTKRNGSELCMSYQESERWFQRHQEILNKSVSLLEVHPRLIQHQCCDRLLDFISKMSVCNYDETTGRVNGISKKLIEQETSSAAMKLPNISISDSDLHEHKDKQLTKKVFIVGKRDDSKWYRMLVGLCEQFLVKFCSDETPDKENNFIDYHHLNGFDILLFIIDESSIHDMDRLKLLKAAKGRGLPVLRVRNEDCSLSIIEEQSALDVTEHTHTNTNNNNVYKQKRPISGLSLTDPESLRPDSGISSLLGRSSSCSTDFRLMSNTTNNVDYDLTPVIDHIDNDRQFTSVHVKAKLNIKKDEMIKIICDEYDNTITYNETYHAACMKSIAWRIEQLTGNTESIVQEHHGLNVRHNQTDTNAKTERVKALELHEADCDHINTRRTRRMSSGTVFMVFPLKMTGGGEPKCVHYHEEGTSSMPLSPSMDSLGFQDIDLSKLINGSDLFSPEDDELTP